MLMWPRHSLTDTPDLKAGEEKKELETSWKSHEKTLNMALTEVHLKQSLYVVHLGMQFGILYKWSSPGRTRIPIFPGRKDANARHISANNCIRGKLSKC